MDSYDELAKAVNRREYSAKVPVVFYQTDVEDDLYIEDTEVEITYDIDFEFRDWGIKDMLVLADIIVVRVPDPRNEDEQLMYTIDVLDGDLDWNAGSAIVPTALDLHIDKDFKMTSSTLTVSYIAK